MNVIYEFPFYSVKKTNKQTNKKPNKQNKTKQTNKQENKQKATSGYSIFCNKTLGSDITKNKP